MKNTFFFNFPKYFTDFNAKTVELQINISIIVYVSRLNLQTELINENWQ